MRRTRQIRSRGKEAHMQRSRGTVLFTILLAAGLVLGAQAPAAANLLANPGFEDGGGSYNGWSTFGEGPNISTPADDDIYRTGTAAAKIYGEFTNCPDFPQFDVGGAFQAFTPTPGAEYEFSGYSYVSSADTIPGSDACLGNRLIAKIVFFDSIGSEMSANEIILGDWSTPLDQWIPFTVTAPVPDGAASVQAMLLFLQPACDEGSVFVDDCSFVENTPASEPNVFVNPSFDNDLSGWTAFGNAYYEGRNWGHLTSPGSCKLYGTFSPGDDSGIFQQFAATDGSIWKFDVNVMTTCRETPIQPGNSNVVVANLIFKDASGTTVGSTEQVILDETAPLGTWTSHTLFGTAPASTDSVAAYLLFVQDEVVLEQGAAWIDDVSLYDISTVDVPEGKLGGVTLYQNVPNPFNPVTRIAFELPMRQEVEVVVYNVAGREVATLHEGELPAGRHTITWDGRTNGGGMAASGAYWYQLRTPDGETSRSMVLLK
ncbi:MAG: hypothetical protein GF400_00395 [Candidatus Eisenbacteria bacterium]|nr:hypothetical protein [Candidatus Eisenbacteria bacterium]